MPPTKENSASVHLDLRDTLSIVQGMTIINRFLSALSWKTGQPAINHYGWSGGFVINSVPKYHIPYGFSRIDYYPKSMSEIKNDKAKLAIALYREGLSIDSVPYSFLSYFKILNIFWKDKFTNRRNDLVEGIRSEIENIEDQECIERINHIKEMVDDVAYYLYESGRCAIAHAWSEPIVDPDNIDDLHRLSEDRKIIKIIATNMIKRKFSIEQSILI